MLERVRKFTGLLKEGLTGSKINIISHFDTDGITSAAIFSKCLGKLGIQFSIKILKTLEEEFIESLDDSNTLVFLDLGSGNVESLKRLRCKVFVIDHHEISGEVPENVVMLNPHLFKGENLCGSELTYLVCKEISEDNINLAYLAVIGMVGDVMEKDISRTRNSIIKDAGVTVKRGLLLYPSTRPLDKTLEFSSRPFIPGVTGNSQGVFELLKEAGIERIGRNYKSLIDLSETEMKNLVTAVMLRLNGNEKSSEYIGNLYLIKFFNKIEDARELSAIINACSRLGKSDVSLMLCLGNTGARKKAERLYVKYRQHIISGLKYIENNGNIHGKTYVIINARDNIKDTLIGTLASILSFSSIYKEGTVIVAMAYNGEKIKVSTRLAGRNPSSAWNLKRLMDAVTHSLGCKNSGGHKRAAGCVINKEDEERFIGLLQKKLEVELVRI